MKNSIASTRATESTCSGKRFFPRAADIASAFRAFLSASCTKAAARRLPAQGGEVQLRAGVRGFLVADGRVEGVEREDGSVETADYYLAAVPQDVLPELLPAEVVEREPVFLNLRNLRTSPITGVHLWFDRTVMSEPFLTLLDSTTQWVFNKTQLYGGGAEDGGQYLQLVISASYSLASRSRQEIIALCLEELREVLPATREATLVKGTVVKEMSATFSPAPGSDRWRPAQKSPLSGLFLAGDWTLTGWPSTMEGAVRSRLPGRRSNSLRCRNATEIIAAGFARGRIRAPVGPRIVSNSPRTVLTRNQPDY